MKVTDKYVFFWKENPFCNFTKCKIKFADPYYVGYDEDPMVFTSSEQMFMWKKAQFFNDHEISRKIYETSDPETARKLGREVKNYNDRLWSKERYNIMKSIVQAKFIQNKDLRDELLNPKYEGKHFVEASPYDRVWGIGCDESSALKLDNYKNWGENNLGKILDEVRDWCKKNKDILDYFKVK